MNPEQGGQGEVTQLLGAWRDGDTGARDRMIALVYDQVRQLAARHLRRQYGSQAVTLQPTELANELFIKLLNTDAAWDDRRHFYNAAAVALRRILIDAARARGSDKRGGGRAHLTLSAAEHEAIESNDADVLDDALNALRQLDPRKCEIIEMSYLLGLTREQIASALGVSVPTVDRDLRFARAWLQQRLTA
ncbi:ECF-type sigma factor [Pseudofulvimonas gallinarii]|jgi:RNA polymerase sigma factor (TIGR02999 family)|uniref:RNA polymerase ECF family sigma subunit n=1 Tax=Pseudofulvimonas gallinarii TaxID=634155 RepID=A0A4R3L8G1_9GAMM|nr:ECF-type sigma factor [Pseudofulvimonas gallinarii]TCS95345.1 RNA polymerase ECF family sigma subunit [Pseudofulvimonas gallinarii]